MSNWATDIKPSSPNQSLLKKLPLFEYNEQLKRYETAPLNKADYNTAKHIVAMLPDTKEIAIDYNDFDNTLSMDSESYVNMQNALDKDEKILQR